VIDSSLQIPLNSQVLKEQGAARTIIATTPDADKDKYSALLRQGIEVITTGKDGADRVNIGDLLKKLGEMNISSVLVEGGAEVITSLIHSKLVDKYVVIIAPKVMGKGTDAIGDLGIPTVGGSLKLSFARVFRSGEDLIIEARPEANRG
jgi:diaminohydroxyphosphoribosylaminopyrimidine deaminase/5-amino-6-(5-phosphoribosylamino)uracil reductase